VFTAGHGAEGAYLYFAVEAPGEALLSENPLEFRLTYLFGCGLKQATAHADQNGGQEPRPWTVFQCSSMGVAHRDILCLDFASFW